MKRLTIITSILLLTIVTYTASAQSKYRSVSTDYYKAGIRTSKTIKFVSGNLQVSQETIKIDTSVYTILKHGAKEAADEAQTIQPLLVVTTTKKGSYRVLDCVLLYNQHNKLSAVTIHNSKSSVVSYNLD